MVLILFFTILVKSSIVFSIKDDWTKNYYWYFKEEIPKNVCDDIVRYGNSKVLEQGLVGDQDKPLDNSEIRKSEVCF